MSNSIVRPEIYKFGTQVSSKVTEAYPELSQDLQKPRFAQRLAKAKSFGSRAKSVHSRISGMSDQIFGLQEELPILSQIARLQDEDADIINQETASI